MEAVCRHRAEKALEIYWQRSVSRKESATLATALMNPQAASVHVFLMQNLGMHFEQASQIYEAYAPQDCFCDQEESAVA
jgi:hypothetical protein